MGSSLDYFVVNIIRDRRVYIILWNAGFFFISHLEICVLMNLLKREK